MSSKTGRRILAMWATGVGALGLMAAPTPVHAAPACGEYGFAGPVTIKGDGAIIELNFSANGRSASGPATGLGDKGNALTGTISGGIIGNGPGINLTFTPQGGGGIVFNGAIREDDLIATGTQTSGSWSTAGPLACLDAAEATPNDGTAKVTGDVDMYDAPGGTGNKYPGFLDDKNGTATVQLITCQDDNWCNVINPENQKSVWVWGDFIEH